ncbi:MAG: hypothetical protein Tsb0013_12030 [Phycisphaerales bacterium]
MFTTCALAVASACMLPPAATSLASETKPPALLVTIELRRAELEGGMDAIRSTIQNAPNVVPRGSVGGPAVFIGPSVIFTTRMGYVETIARPRILTNTGEPAEIIVGETVSYIEMGEGGSLELVEMEGAYEGLRLAMTPEVDAGGAIGFSSFEVTLSEVIGRVDIASPDDAGSLPIAGGRPVLRSVTYAMPLSLAPIEGNDDREPPTQRADIVFASDADDEMVFWMTVSAEVSAGD